MPDATVEREPSERRPYNPSRPAIHDTGYHKFKESEFAEGKGYCDHCGGGPDAEVHQKPIDQSEQLKRIADALERLVSTFDYARALFEKEREG
jgi:hypothetical protein